MYFIGMQNTITRKALTKAYQNVSNLHNTVRCGKIKKDQKISLSDSTQLSDRQCIKKLHYWDNIT